MRKYFILVSIVLLAVIFSYLNTFSATIEKALLKKNIPFSEIVAGVEIDEGTLVYYYNELNQSYAHH